MTSEIPGAAKILFAVMEIGETEKYFKRTRHCHLFRHPGEVMDETVSRTAVAKSSMNMCRRFQQDAFVKDHMLVCRLIYVTAVDGLV